MSQTTPLSGTVVVHMLGLATIDLCTEFEISTFSHYEDMKDDEKFRN